MIAGRTWRTLSDADKTLLVSAYEGGKTARECAELTHGVDQMTILDWLRKLGVQIRPKGCRKRNASGINSDPSARGAIISSAAIMEQPRPALDDGRRWL